MNAQGILILTRQIGRFKQTLTLYPLGALPARRVLLVGTGGGAASWGITIGTLTAFVLLFQRFFEPIMAVFA
jgi:hypothetical protein